MNKSNLIENLNKGLFLEKSNVHIPWEIPFNELKKFGNPELKKHSEQRTDLIWKDEHILNGLNVNLIVMRWSGIARSNKKFTRAFSYITEKEFEETKIKLGAELRQKGKLKKINELEYKYSWNLKRCKIELRAQERFGPFWTISINHKSKSWFSI